MGKEKIKTNQIKIGVILSYLIILLNVNMGIILTPFMLKMLGQSQYGLYQLIGAFVGYMTILDFGLGIAVIRYVAKYRQQKDKKSESNFLAMVLIMYGVISICVVIIGIILYFNLGNIFTKTFTPVELAQAKIMFIILVIKLAISLPGNTFNAITNAYEKYAFNRGFTLFRLVFRVLLLILLLKMGYNAISIVILDTAINMLTILVNTSKTRKDPYGMVWGETVTGWKINRNEQPNCCLKSYKNVIRDNLKTANSVIIAKLTY